MSINEDGYRLWFRYQKIGDDIRLSQYREMIEGVTILENGVTYDIIKDELDIALPVILDKQIRIGRTLLPGKILVAGTVENLKKTHLDISRADCLDMGDEGFLIRHDKGDEHARIILSANTAKSVITGMFYFLRLLQTHQDIQLIHILSLPRIRHRLLCHWDNIDGSIERGYAGWSLWKWDELPDTINSRYRDYARACASIGINGSILNNVNSQAEFLSTEYLVKIAALADIFRPYGIRVFLSPPFNAPAQLGGLKTADPRNTDVIRWWREKVDEIYGLIPDFGGFQVKAGSEGQPGPQEYGANHHDGANMLADVLRDHEAMVLWRAFVYDTAIDKDRAKCAFKEFVPLDGNFAPGAFLQVKNGPVDFQPREPFHPLFGAMAKTPMALELQITQEYLGQAVHLVYLAPMWKEILDADTYACGEGSTVSRVVDGSLYGNAESAIVGVSNTGSDRNWCGHHFAQANWYAFGCLAWDHHQSSEDICEEWIRMTWSNDPVIVESIKTMMLGSWEACVDYMTPLGLHHIMQEGHHYGPDPAFSGAAREDWNSVYYHRADKEGLGFDRSSTGSNAVGQYLGPLSEEYDSLETCPEKYLLWFHHVPWDYRFDSGNALFEEIRDHYNFGVEYITGMKSIWKSLRGKIDPQRFEHVKKKLEEQQENGALWRAVCTEYFQQFNGPDGK
ncbi:MAG: hypothetical protein JW762_05140 [Dehalococcoidales bacterium]|nr:hypothetical protein [Dehalococcoidales bacterium]